jgi:hypothetical protein
MQLTLNNKKFKKAKMYASSIPFGFFSVLRLCQRAAKTEAGSQNKNTGGYKQ